MPKAYPAGSAEIAVFGPPAILGGACPALRLAADELDIGLAHPEAHAENPSGLHLAVVAMADCQPYGLAREAIADLAALATPL